MAKHWIQEAISEMKKGSFTAQAKRSKMEPFQYAKFVLQEPEKHIERTRKRAQFLVNLSKFTK
jgi:hypothetical protein